MSELKPCPRCGDSHFMCKAKKAGIFKDDMDYLIAKHFRYGSLYLCDWNEAKQEAFMEELKGADSES